MTDKPFAAPREEQEKAPQFCKAEEWNRDGRGLWAERHCTDKRSHVGRHRFSAWRYNVQPPALSTPSPVSRAEMEREVIDHVVAHWFTQGGEAQFGYIGRPTNADEVVSNILEAVRRPGRSRREPAS